MVGRESIGQWAASLLPTLLELELLVCCAGWLRLGINIRLKETIVLSFPLRPLPIMFEQQGNTVGKLGQVRFIRCELELSYQRKDWTIHRVDRIENQGKCQVMLIQRRSVPGNGGPLDPERFLTHVIPPLGAFLRDVLDLDCPRIGPERYGGTDQAANDACTGPNDRSENRT